MLAIAQPYNPPADVLGPHRIPSTSSSSSSYRRPTTRAATTSSFTAPPAARPSVHLHIRPSTPPPPPPPAPAPPPPPALNIHSYPAPDLLRLLASLLTQIAATNDSLSPLPSPTSPHHALPAHTHTDLWPTLTTASRAALTTPAATLTFHARNVPTISLEAYLLRILKYCPTTNEVFLSLLVYFDRMSKLSGDAVGRSFVIDSYNIHRLVIAGVTVASKFFSDVFYTNSRYAKVGGLPLAELNQLELQFLLLNDFRLVISATEMQRYAEQLILFSSDTPSSPPPPPPKSDPPGPALHRMGAIDAYGGALPGTSTTVPQTTHPQRTPQSRSHLQPPASAPSLSHQPRPPSATSMSSASASETETETETEAETEADTETTDDEPTIRPGRGSVLSDAGSVYSVDVQAGGAGAMETQTQRPQWTRARTSSGVWDTGDEGGDEEEDDRGWNEDGDASEGEGEACDERVGMGRAIGTGAGADVGNGIGRVRRGSAGSGRGRVRKRVRGVVNGPGPGEDAVMQSP